MLFSSIGESYHFIDKTYGTDGLPLSSATMAPSLLRIKTNPFDTTHEEYPLP
jgi:hypothetical protein